MRLSYLRYLPLAIRLIKSAIKADVVDTIQKAFADRRLTIEEAFDIITRLCKVVGINFDSSNFIFKK